MHYFNIIFIIGPEPAVFMFNSNMAAKRLPWYLLLFLLVLIRSRFSSAKEEFHEELLVKPFPTGEVLTYFQFTTLWDVQIYDNDACKFVIVGLL